AVDDEGVFLGRFAIGRSGDEDLARLAAHANEGRGLPGSDVNDADVARVRVAEEQKILHRSDRHSEQRVAGVAGFVDLVLVRAEDDETGVEIGAGDEDLTAIAGLAEARGANGDGEASEQGACRSIERHNLTSFGRGDEERLSGFAVVERRGRAAAGGTDAEQRARGDADTGEIA